MPLAFYRYFLPCSSSISCFDHDIVVICPIYVAVRYLRSVVLIGWFAVACLCFLLDCWCWWVCRNVYYSCCYSSSSSSSHLWSDCAFYICKYNLKFCVIQMNFPRKYTYIWLCCMRAHFFFSCSCYSFHFVFLLSRLCFAQLLSLLSVSFSFIFIFISFWIFTVFGYQFTRKRQYDLLFLMNLVDIIYEVLAIFSIWNDNFFCPSHML